MKVRCVQDYFGDPATRFFIWKGEVKDLPENISPELEQAMDQGLLIETKEPIKESSMVKDEVSKTNTLKG